MARTNAKARGGAIAASFAVLTFATAACAQLSIAHPREVAKVFEEATAAGDAAAIAALYADKAIMLLPGRPVVSGREAIRGVFERNFKLGPNSIKFGAVQVDGNDERAVVVSTWVSEIKPQTGAAVRTAGRSMLYFVKSPDAGWRISADMMQPGLQR